MPILKPLICALLCISAIITFLSLSIKNSGTKADNEQAVLAVWQIDSFEGGKGSRADFLQKLGKDFSASTGCFVNVISVSADALRMNLKEGVYPDIISYGAGTYGIESYIEGFSVWCRGGYCFLSLEPSADFSDINKDNTIVNKGKDNFAGAAAIMCGLSGAAMQKPTGAYVKLINGEYKYLLGTQRDIYRLKTRGVSFTVKPITQYNDLYQNVSVVSASERKGPAQEFIEYILGKADAVSKLGLMTDKTVFDDEMKIMQNIDCEYKLTSPMSMDAYDKLKNIIQSGDINMLKNLLK